MYASVLGGDASDVDFLDSLNNWFTANEYTEDRVANRFFSERGGAEDAHRLYCKTRKGTFSLCCIYHIPEQRSSDPNFFTAGVDVLFDIACNVGIIYSPKQGHSVNKNLSWMLGAIHSKKTFLIKSLPFEKRIWSKNRQPFLISSILPQDIQTLRTQGNVQTKLYLVGYNGYAREITAALSMGYTVDVDSIQGIRLIPPEVDLSHVTLRDLLGSYKNTFEYIHCFRKSLLHPRITDWLKRFELIMEGCFSGEERQSKEKIQALFLELTDIVFFLKDEQKGIFNPAISCLQENNFSPEQYEEAKQMLMEVIWTDLEKNCQKNFEVIKGKNFFVFANIENPNTSSTCITSDVHFSDIKQLSSDLIDIKKQCQRICFDETEIDDGAQLMFDSLLRIGCDFLCDVHAETILRQKLDAEVVSKTIEDSSGDHLLLSTSTTLLREPLSSAAVAFGKDDTVSEVSTSVDLDTHDLWNRAKKTSQQQNIQEGDPDLSSVNNHDYK